MKKIIHIAQSAGGVAEYIYMLLNNINDGKYENILIVSQDYKLQEERFKNIVSKIYYVEMKREIDIKYDIKSIFQVRKIIKKEKPDIVYLHSSKAGAIGRIALCFNKKIKKIYNAHGWAFNANLKGNKKIYAIIEKILAFNTDKIINISKYEYETAKNNKISNDKKMCIIENGIEFNKFLNSDIYRKITRKKYDISENEILIGVVGRISEQKDPITTIKAFSELTKKINNVKLMYVGNGELEDKVIEISKKNNILKNVIITGWVNDVEKYIPAFDIAILPSKWEGFGLVIIEYIACKKPIVATKVGGIQNIINDGIKGILIEQENSEQLYKSLCEYINNKSINENDLEKNYELAYQRFNIKNVVYEHEKIFDSI